MRWVIFVLLALGALFGLGAVAPAAPAGLGDAWSSGAVGGSVATIVRPILGAAAGLLFLAALVGLFSTTIPMRGWSGLVVAASVVSLLLYAPYFGPRVIAPIAVDAVLLVGLVAGWWAPGVRRMRSISDLATGVHPILRVPVPWVYVLVFLVGVGLHLLAPILVPSAGLRRIGLIVGAVLMATGVLIAVWSLGIFRSVRTTTVPFETASQLVVSGPYRFTRNPMYLGLALAYLGEAAMLAELWPVILLPLVLLYVRTMVIPVEEARLRGAFGDAYVHYCSTVRRWI
ncbi:MAG TPA: isoprenylcysteine carboxylmethyltransferase family protein [Longimicrobiaceae bacterium]|nr:isoprenylcysteine carboxylmethyltransferase family protein [Longimicrobiaceae bacterium]